MYIYDEYLENESILHMNMQIRNEKGHKYRDRKNNKITRQDTQVTFSAGTCGFMS